jgi:hypothetical protein
LAEHLFCVCKLSISHRQAVPSFAAPLPFSTIILANLCMVSGLLVSLSFFESEYKKVSAARGGPPPPQTGSSKPGSAPSAKSD